MTLDKLLQYVVLDVDDTDYTLSEIAKWFNKGIAQYNLIAPLTLYPFYTMEYTTQNLEDPTAIHLGYSQEYPLEDNFMLGIMLPYINAMVKSQEASLDEKYGFDQTFARNGKVFKTADNVLVEYLRNKTQLDLDIYQIGEGVYLSDMRSAPFPSEWGQATVIPVLNIPVEEE